MDLKSKAVSVLLKVSIPMGLGELRVQEASICQGQEKVALVLLISSCSPTCWDSTARSCADGAVWLCWRSLGASEPGLNHSSFGDPYLVPKFRSSHTWQPPHLDPWSVRRRCQCWDPAEHSERSRDKVARGPPWKDSSYFHGDKNKMFLPSLQGLSSLVWDRKEINFYRGEMEHRKSPTHLFTSLGA